MFDELDFYLDDFGNRIYSNSEELTTYEKEVKIFLDSYFIY